MSDLARQIDILKARIGKLESALSQFADKSNWQYVFTGVDYEETRIAWVMNDIFKDGEENLPFNLARQALEDGE